VFVLGLLSGAFNSIASKAAYQTVAEGAGGRIGFFDKPWFMSLVMFLAMSLALPIYWYLHHSKQDKPLNLRSALILGLPAVLDLFGTSVQQMGLTVIPVSTFQMLKGSILIFSAWFSKVWLGRKMRMRQWSGVGLCCLALAFVGLATILIREDQVKVTSLRETVFGISLVLLGQVICAAQYVLEEFLLKPPKDVPALAMVGVEGVWGSVLMVCVILPGLSRLPGKDAGGTLENFDDSLIMIGNSSQVRWTLAAFFMSCLVFNICGVVVTQQASAIHHTFLDASRTIFVWLGSLYLFYYSTDQALGEPLTNWSWLQAVGFLILIVGQLVYDDREPAKDELTETLL